MKLTKVTLTGADDSIDPMELVKISQEFPFVEWGILLSRSQRGNPRFPSREWLSRLRKLESSNFFIETQYSAHLCGQYAREILLGNDDFTKEIADTWIHFGRVQINTHGQPHHVNEQLFIGLFSDTHPDTTVILQLDGMNYHLVTATHGKIDVAGLHDLSHGAGVLPAEWPGPINGLPVGYAGGLGPDNVEEQLKRIADAAGPGPFWIDMETKIRSDDGKAFDLKKCQKVLEAVERYIQPEF